MQLNLNNQETSMISSSRSALKLAPSNPKTWWQTLSQEEKQKICRLDASDIMSDLANAANNALVVCKLNHTYKKKDLISWTKSKNQDNEVISQTFEFSLVNKEVIDDSWATLFSCFYIFVGKRQNQSSQCQLKSHIGVKQERLDSILDFLSHSRCSFEEGGSRLPFQKKEQLSALYFSLIHDATPNVSFSTNLPAYLRVLFERLTVYSFILEHHIFSTYIEENAFLLDPMLNKEAEGVKQPSTLSPLVSTASLMFKTVAQLEKDYISQEQSVDQNSTASGSPRNPIILVAPAHLNLEELNQKLLQTSPKAQHKCSFRKTSDSDSSNESKPRIAEVFAQPNLRKNSQRSYNEVVDSSLFIYEGCYVGNLQMTFEITDPIITEEEEESSSDEETEREFGILEYDEIFEVFGQENEESNEKEEHEMNYDKMMNVQTSLNSFNVTQSSMANYPLVYSMQQQFLYLNQEFYVPYCAQQVQPMVSCGYAVPQIHMSASNLDCSQAEMSYHQANYMAENISYAYYNNRPKELEPYLNYENESNYNQMQNTGENFKNDTYYYATPNEKNYGKDKPRYDTRPKLPPRLQKRKENTLRT